MFLYKIFLSARATTWIRIAAELILGFAWSGGAFSTHSGKLIIAFLALGPFLSTASYIFNDLTDIKFDREHAMRKERPVASGALGKNPAFMAVLVFFGLALYAGAQISSFFVSGIILLGVLQIGYTARPWRFKEKRFFDLATNGVAAGLRFAMGYQLGATFFDKFPWYFLFFAICLKLILFLGHRTQNREIEKKFGFNSTVAFLDKKTLNYLLSALILLAGFFYIISVFFYRLPLSMLLLPVLLAIFLTPMFGPIRRGYLHNAEATLFWRVYLYSGLLMFSLGVYYLLN